MMVNKIELDDCEAPEKNFFKENPEQSNKIHRLLIILVYILMQI